VANFGRGVLADVSDKLLAQFSDNLNTLLDQDTPTEAPAEAETDTSAAPSAAADGVVADAVVADAAPAADASAEDTAAEPTPETPAPPKVRTIDGPAAEPIDLLEHAGAPVLKILVPLLGGLAILFFLLRRRKS
jgi:hypothetical protein